MLQDRVFSCTPDATRGPWVAVRDETGAELAGGLWTHRACWPSVQGPLDLQVLADAALDLPRSTPDEPAVGVLARLLQACPVGRSAVCLHYPGRNFAPEQAGLLEGVRLIGVADEDDQAWWDAALSAGHLCYALRGRLRFQLSSARPDVGTVFVGLACGLFACEDGLAVHELVEEPGVTRWCWDDPEAHTAVIVRDGYEAARFGHEGRWRDQGSEGYVRLSASSPAGGRLLTQPRLVVGGGPGG